MFVFSFVYGHSVASSCIRKFSVHDDFHNSGGELRFLHRIQPCSCVSNDSGCIAIFFIYKLWDVCDSKGGTSKCGLTTFEASVAVLLTLIRKFRSLFVTMNEKEKVVVVVLVVAVAPALLLLFPFILQGFLFFVFAVHV